MITLFRGCRIIQTQSSKVEVPQSTTSNSVLNLKYEVHGLKCTKVKVLHLSPTVLLIQTKYFNHS